MKIVTIFLLINAGALVTSIGGILLAKMRETTEVSDLLSPRILTHPSIYAIGVCYLAPIILWFYLLRYVPIHVLQPTLAVVYVYTFILSYYFLNATITFQHIIGSCVIFVGIAILSLKSS